jgi:YesN/AraC family two-component response regulator
VASLREIWVSYRESMEASQTMRLTETFTVRWYRKGEDRHGAYRYPVDLEERLMNNIKAGNRQEVHGILDRIQRENSEDLELSAAMLGFLMRDISCTTVKLLDQITAAGSDAHRAIMDRLDDLPHHKAFDDCCAIVRSICDQLCDCVDSAKRSHKRDLAEKMRAFIHAHAHEVTLNRHEVAREFSMTEQYLSSFFREQTGVYFSAYLEQQRMAKARELLADGAAAVHEIAASVGYGSVNAFCRAFKRHSGLSPGEYRKVRAAG